MKVPIHSILSYRTRPTMTSFTTPIMANSVVKTASSTSTVQIGFPTIALVQTMLKRTLPVAGPLFFLALQVSSIQTALKIISQRSTGKLSHVPFVSLLINSFIWTLYGWMRKDLTVFLPNGTGIFAATFCIWAFHTNAEVKPWSIYGIIASSLIAGVLLTSAGQVEVIGLIGCVLSVLLSGSPLAVIKTVIKDRSTAALPFGTSFITWINNFSWSCYGYFVAKDHLIYGPSALGFLLSSIQMALFLRYGISSSGLNMDKKDSEKIMKF